MQRLLLLVCSLAYLLAAWCWSSSTTGFLVTGLAPALLLDRYICRFLPWPCPVAWPRETCTRLGYAALGSIAVYLSRPGSIPVGEAVLLGTCVSLVVSLIESFVSLTARWTGRSLWLALVASALTVIALPLVALHRPHTVPKRTPAAQGLAFEDIRFPASDGIVLGGWLVPHAQARANVIFCHGHGRNRGHGAGLLPTLHALRLNVLAFDFRGHGDSPAYTLTFGHREVNDLRGAAAYLAERYPGKPLFIVGISYGAAVTLQALPELPGVAGVWSEGCFARLNHVVANVFRPAPAWLRRGLVTLYDELALLDCGFRGRDINPIEHLAGVRVPIYFCHARRDELVPFAEAEALYAAYAGPKEHWWVEDAVHYNVRQRHRDEYLERLRGFLMDHLPAFDE